MRAYKQGWVDFTAVPNEIFRHGLSLKAIGLYCYIASKPDGWDFSISGASSQLRDAKVSIQSAIRELEENGFLKRVQGRKPDGDFGKSVWYIYGTPAENAAAQNATAQNQIQVITNRVKTKRERGKNSPPLFFEETVELEKCSQSLTPDLIQKFVGPHSNETDVLTSAKKCFAWHLSKGKVPSNWTGALYYWLSNEDWGKND